MTDTTRRPAGGPERDALLSCARVGPSGDGVDDLRTSLLRLRDWSSLRDWARYHGMLPLLHRNVTTCCADAIPGEWLAELRELNHVLVQRSMRQTAHLLRVLALLRSGGVAALPIKGPALAQALYGDVAMRQFTDLDIVVSPGDVTHARDVLLADGYRVVLPRTAVRDSILLRCECEVPMQRPEANVVLELHWRVGPRFAHASLSADALFDRACTATLLGREILTLGHEDVFITLCLHGCAHRWDRLENIVAVATVVNELLSADWEALLRCAMRDGYLRRIVIAALLARDVAGIDLPELLAAAASRDSVAATLAGQARAALFERPDDVSQAGGFPGIFWQALSLDTVRERWRHLTLRTVTPGAKDWDAFPLPVGLESLYYLVRPARLAAQYVSRRANPV